MSTAHAVYELGINVARFTTPSAQDIQRACARLHETIVEALLEARDEADIRAIRTRGYGRLDSIFITVMVMNQEMVLLKLDAMERLERECSHAICNVVERSHKWRQALITRHFGN